MDRDKVKVAVESTQNYGSTAVAVLLAMIGLQDIPFELLDKTVGWYMSASRDELVKASVLIFAAVVCFLYKNPRYYKEARHENRASAADPAADA